MRFIVDANLPPALALWLASQGHEAHHVDDLAMADVDDRTIWRRARELDACIMTKDEDFVLLHALDRQGPAVIWVRIGNASTAVLLRRLPAVMPEIVASIERGEKIVEVSA